MRIELCPARIFDLVVAAVLVPLRAWLALTRPARPKPLDSTRRSTRIWRLARLSRRNSVMIGADRTAFPFGPAAEVAVTASPGDCPIAYLGRTP
jgi:hypothetical protein